MTAGYDGTFRVWNTRNGQEITRLGDVSNPQWWAAFSADGRRIVTTGQNDTTAVWDRTTRRLIFQVVRGFFSASEPILSGDGSRVARYDSSRGLVEIWRVDREDAATRDAKPPDQTFRVHRRNILNVHFVGNRLRAVVLDPDVGLEVWEESSNSAIARIRAPRMPRVHHAQFSGDGVKIALACADGTLHLWDTRSGTLRRLTQFVETNTPHAAFNRNGSRVAMVTDGAVEVWDSTTGESILRFRLSGRHDNRVAFSPDGERLATWGHDAAVRVWPATTEEFIHVGRKLLRYTPHWEVAEKVSAETRRARRSGCCTSPRGASIVGARLRAR